MDYLDVSFKLIKGTIAYTALPLTHIINISFQSEIFPDAMKLAKVIPLFKQVIKDLSVIIDLYHYFTILKKY